MLRMEQFQDENLPPLNEGYLGEEKEKPSKKKGFKHYCSEVFAESSVTGVSSVIHSEGWSRKLVKLIILSLGVAGFLTQTLEFLRLYQEYSTVDFVDRLDIMKKPAVTICDDNILRRRVLCKNRPEVCQKWDGSDKEFCKVYMPYCSETEEVFYQVPDLDKLHLFEYFFDYNFTKRNGFLLENSILECTWLSTDRSKNDSVKYTPCGEPEYLRVMTNEKVTAACYTLKSSPHMLDEELQKNSMLRLTFNWHASDLIVEPNRVTNEITRVGFFWISFHYPGHKSNPFVDGFKLGERYLYNIEVSETDYIRMPPPYSTKCHDYVKEWKENGFQGPLEKEHCQALCEINARLERFGCVPREIDFPHDKKICWGPGYLNEIFDPAMTEKIQECSDQCREPCSYSKYFAVTEIGKKIDRPVAKYVYQNQMVTRVDVRFNHQKSQVITSRPKYESVELFSYIGGYLGMWLGWSLVAVFDFIEIFFFAMKRPFIQWTRRIQKTTIRPFVNQQLHPLEK